MRIVSLNQDKGVKPDSHKGAAVHLRAMRKAFTSLGHEVIVVDEDDVDCVARYLSEAHRERPVDLIYERYSLGKSAGADFSEQTQVPMVLEVNAPLAAEVSRWRGKQESFSDRINDKRLFEAPKKILAVSPEIAQYTIDRGARADKVFVCANGIDEQVFYQRNRRQCKQSLGIDPDQLVVGFHGRLRPWHGFDRLVDVLEELKRFGLPVHLLIAGEGDFAALLSGRFQPTDYTQLGWVNYSDIGDVVGAFDLLPLTYDADVPCYFSPLKLYEAMACGVVPLVPDLGNLAEVIDHHVNGVVYQADAYLEQLPASIRRLWEAPEFWLALSGAAHRSVMIHTWDQIAVQVLESVGLLGNV